MKQELECRCKGEDWSMWMCSSKGEHRCVCKKKMVCDNHYLHGVFITDCYFCNQWICESCSTPYKQLNSINVIAPLCYLCYRQYVKRKGEIFHNKFY